MRLSLRFRKFLLALASGLFLASAALVVAWGVQVPDLATEQIAVPAGHSAAAGSERAGETRGPAKEDFAELSARPLRQPLYDPPPPKPEVKQLPPLQVELLGTILEPENSIAIVRSAQGSTEYKRVGDAIGPPDSPAEVLEIQGDSIALEREGERISLQVRGREVR